MRILNIIHLFVLFHLSFIFCSQICDNASNKCKRGFECVKKNETVSLCRKKCPVKWACYEEIRNSSKNQTFNSEFSSFRTIKDVSSNRVTESYSKNLTQKTDSITTTAIIASSKPMIEITSTSYSAEINVLNRCGSCSNGMHCFLVENFSYKCSNECNPNWACNKTANQNSSIIYEPLITEEEFNNAMTEAGYFIYSAKKYTYIVSLATKAGNITSKRELAMFLAQILWESDGLKAVREYACANGCPNEYITNDDIPGKSYYGRGYIQLTWAGNYKAASYDLFNDDRLYKNPDLVAENEELSWATAFWYWKKHVKSRPGIELGYFGESTDAINGKLECFDGPNVHKAKLRFNLYKKILKGLNINEEPIEKGCY